jgi:hypothetical protein
MRARTRSWWPVLLAAVIFPACRRHALPGPSNTYTHPTIGLTLTVPRAWGKVPIIVKEQPDGFEVRREHTRTVGPVTVKLVPGVPSPLGYWPDTRTVGGAEVHYIIVDLKGGGSGGEQYQLTAWRRARNGHLLYDQFEQSEMGEPDFELAWSVIEGTKLSP